MEEGETEPAEGEAGRARKSWGPGGGERNQPPRRGRQSGRRGSRRESGRKGRTAQGGDEDGGSRFIRRCCCGSILVTSPSPPASSCNAAGHDGPGGEPPGCPSAPPGFRGTQGWVPVAAQRRGRAGWWGKREDAGFREGAGWGRQRPDQCSIPQGSCQPWGQRAAAPTRIHAAQSPASPRSALRLQPPSHPAARSRSTCTPPRLTGIRGPSGAGARGRGTPRSTHTCAHTRVRTPRPRGHHAAPAAQTPCTPAARSHCLPRLHADASERDGRLDTRRYKSPRRPRGGGGAPPGRSPAARPARESGPYCLPRPSARTYCWPRCG